MLVGARSYYTEPPPAAARAARSGGAVRVGRPLRAASRRAAGGRPPASHDGWQAVAFADDNSIVDREVAYRAGIGWFGKNANLLLPGAGSWFVLGCVVTTAPLPPAAEPVADGCGSCRRCLDACPTGAIIAPGVIDAGRCLAWVLQKPGVIDRRWRAVIGDRIYGCDDCQDVCPPTVRLGGIATPRADTQIEPWVSLIAVLDASRRRGDAALGSLVPRRPRPALGASQRTGRARQHRRSRPTASVRRCLTRYLAHDDPMLRAHAVWAARRLGLDSLLPTDDADRAGDGRDGGRAVKHLLVTNDFPPKIGGIQSLLWEWWRRLPPDSFAVLTSPYAGAAAFDAEQPFHIERTREPVLLPHPWMVPRVNEMAARVGADLVVLDPAVPLGLVGPSLRPAVRRRAARRRGHRARSPAGHEAGARLRAARRPAHRRRRRLSGSARPSAPPAAACRSPSSRPASTPTGSARLSHDERLAARGPIRPAGRRRAGRRHQPAGAAQGLRHGDPGGRDAAPHATRPGAGDRRRRPRRAAAATARRRARCSGAVPRAGSATTTCRACTAAPTCTRCCAATGGAGSNRRASASCSSRPRRAGCRRWPATPAGRPKPSSTASPAWWSATPTTPREVAAAFERLLDDPELRRTMGRAGRAPGRRGVLLRRAWPTRLGASLGALP